MNKEVKNLEELHENASQFLKSILEQSPKMTATVVGLSGNLGAGKTAFTKGIAEILGITEVVTSPTFILEKLYAIPPSSIGASHFSQLVHIDAYRLEDKKEMRALGWEALLLDPRNLIFLEWPEQVEGALPSDTTLLFFEHIDEGTRRITKK